MQLHLNPIHAVVQLRPSLEHLRSSGLKRKNNVTGDANDNVKLEESSERKPVVLKKQVLFFPFQYYSALLQLNAELSGLTDNNIIS